MRRFFKNINIAGIFYLIAALIIPTQRYFLGHYNNFKIFQNSTFHFFGRTNMYIEYPDKYYDLFLYNPSFALLFAPFSFMPTIVGIYAWVGFVLAIYYVSVRLLPFGHNEKLFIYAFTFIELVTSLENLQTNPLIAAFILFTFIYLEKEKEISASLFPSLGFFIKGYGAVSGILILLKKPKFRSVLFGFSWFIIFLCLPLVHYTPGGLVNLYAEWKSSLLSQHSSNTGLSVMSIINSVFGLKLPVIWIQLAAIFLFIMTVFLVFKRKNYEKVKFHFLAYILIWIIIFNHVAESATYIIAVTGVAVWFIKSSRSLTDKILLILVFILTVLSSTDIFPDFLYRNYVYPYSLKALGPFLVWLKIQAYLFTSVSQLQSNDKR